MICPFDGAFSPRFYSPISPQSAFSERIREETQMYNNKNMHDFALPIRKIVHNWLGWLNS